tara:strand:- start:809 stop:1198 length:390 start_codon:yes stop_codon:yes gene_type:complete
MKSIIKTLIFAVAVSLPSQAVSQGPRQPVIPKMSKFSGVIFRGFAEFRIQNSSFDTKGLITLEDIPYKAIFNCNNIVKVHRFEDGKGTDYSCLMFISDHKHPTEKLKAILVRETYDEVWRKMKRAIESR